MAIEIPVEADFSLDGGLKSNRAGMRCTGGSVVVCLAVPQAKRSTMTVRTWIVFFIKRSFGENNVAHSLVTKLMENRHVNRSVYNIFLRIPNLVGLSGWK